MLLRQVMIEEKDKSELQKKYYTWQAYKSLIFGTSVPEAVYTKYEAAFEQYNRCWQRILTDYAKDIAITPSINYECDFNTNIVIITEV